MTLPNSSRIKRVTAEHRPQDVEASASQRQVGLGRGFGFASFAVAAGARGGVDSKVAGAQHAPRATAETFEVRPDAAGGALHEHQSGYPGEAVDRIEGAHVASGFSEEIRTPSESQAGQAQHGLSTIVAAESCLDDRIRIAEFGAEGYRPPAGQPSGHTLQLLAGHGGVPRAGSNGPGSGDAVVVARRAVMQRDHQWGRSTGVPAPDGKDQQTLDAPGSPSIRLRVAIIGAGIGGLSLGIALQERGIQAEVFEQALELGEIGAAIALSANSLREFARVGLVDELATESTIPTALIFRRWEDGVRVAVHPVGEDNWYEKRFGAPFFGIHRADLQKVLIGAFGAENLRLGCRLVNIVEDRDSVRLEFANGHVARADLVVGADGVNSTVRRWVTGADDTVYSGTSGFRGVVPVENLPSLPDPQAIQFWMGPDAHVLHYPIGGDGGAVNFLAVLRGPAIWPHPNKVVNVDDELPVSSFRGWHPAITEMIKAAHSPLSWALFAVRPLLRWHRGRVVILGDAAHGMLPHHGQGANTSTEDAFALAGLLAAADDPLAALPQYQALRRGRTRAIQRSSWVTGSLLHVPDGPMTTARDGKMTSIPQDFAWIHGYDVQQELQKKSVMAGRIS